MNRSDRDRIRRTERPRLIHWVGLAVAVILFALLVADGHAAAAFGLTGVYIAITVIWHAIRGSSWLTLATLFGVSPLVLGTVVAVAFIALGLLLPSTAEKPVDVPEASPTSSPTTAVPAPSEQPTVTPSGTHPAADVLAELPIRKRDPYDGFHRNEFGERWIDVDHNGCDTRNDILGRDLTSVEYRRNAPTCVVSTGILTDPYTGVVIDFERGPTSSEAVQIDHVVSLGDAWRKGAQHLTFEQRTAFANDPLNLLAVDGPTNFLKGSRDAAAWLPPNEAFHCQYVETQIAVKAKYSLWVAQAEHDAMLEVLAGC